MDYHGNHVQFVQVFFQGVSAYGIVESEAGLTIFGGWLFAKAAAVAQLKKQNFEKADKLPQTNNQQM